MVEIRVVIPDVPNGEPAWNPEKQELAFQPAFYRGERSSVAAALIVEVDGQRFGQYVLKINGKTGDVQLIDRTKPVVPSIGQVKAESKPEPETPK